MRVGETRSFDQYQPNRPGFGRDEDVRLSELLRRFTQDAGALVRHEVALAKLELRDSVKGYAKDAGKIGVAAGAGLLGVFALTAFAIIGLGALIGSYWLSAFIVAAVLLGTAALLARNAIGHLRQTRLVPDETIASLEADKEWAQHEAHDLKRKLSA